MSVLPFLPHRRTGDRRDRGSTHDEEGTNEKAGRKRRNRAGEVRPELVRCGCIGSEFFTTFLASNQSLQRNLNEDKAG